jgi:hypothetical protein
VWSRFLAAIGATNNGLSGSDPVKMCSNRLRMSTRKNIKTKKNVALHKFNVTVTLWMVIDYFYWNSGSENVVINC